MASAGAGVVEVHGRGLAAYASALACARVGLSCRLVQGPHSPTPGPFVVLNDVGISLLRELCPQLDVPSLGRVLDGRIVKWGDDPIASVRTPAVAVESEALVRALENLVEANPHIDVVAHADPLAKPPAWVLLARGVRGDLAERDPRVVVQGGERRALVVDVDLEEARCERYRVESVEGGWLMLVPTTTRGRGVLQVVVPPAARGDVLDAMLRRSTLIGPHVRVREVVANVSIAPCSRVPFACSGALTVGGAAARLDPISGEGIPFSLRSCLLAAAVVAGIETGQLDREVALSHYRDRLALAVLAHLRGCASFYAEAFAREPAWRVEIGAMLDAHESLRQLTHDPSAANLRLQFDGHGLRPAHARS